MLGNTLVCIELQLANLSAIALIHNPFPTMGEGSQKRETMIPSLS